MKKSFIAFLMIWLLLSATLSATAAESTCSIYLNGVKQDVDVLAENGRVLIELDDCTEMLQMITDYDSANREISIYKKRGVLERYSLCIGRQKVFLGGTVYAMLDTSPTIKDGLVYFPLRCAAEIMNADIRWDNRRKAVEIDQNYGMYQRSGVWYYDAVPISELPGYTKIDGIEYLNAQDYWGTTPVGQVLWQYQAVGSKRALFDADRILDYRIDGEFCYVLAQRTINTEEKVYIINLSRPEATALETDLDWEQ